MSRVRLMALMVAVGSILIVTSASAQMSGTFSGRVWHDINRNGLQDEGEPGMSNLAIRVVKYMTMSGAWSEPVLGVFYTDADGYYDFSFSTNHSFYVIFRKLGTFGDSPLNVGDNDMIDADFGGGHYVTNDLQSYENMDLGLYRWNPGATFDVQLNQLPPGQSLYTTNGSPVTITYRVTNTGETHLSNIYVYDEHLDDLVDTMDCPKMLPWGESWTITTQVMVYASATNTVAYFATPVNLFTCDSLDDAYNYALVETIIIVDSWSDELKIQSLNMSGELAFTEIEHATGYQVQWKTNFMDDVWSAQSPPDIAEIPSLGPGLRVTTLDLDISVGLFRLAAVTNQ